MRWEWSCERAASCVALMECSSSSSRTDGCGVVGALACTQPKSQVKFFEVMCTVIRRTGHFGCCLHGSYVGGWCVPKMRQVAKGRMCGTCQLDSPPPRVTINSPGAHPTPKPARAAKHSTAQHTQVPQHTIACTQAEQHTACGPSRLDAAGFLYEYTWPEAGTTDACLREPGNTRVQLGKTTTAHRHLGVPNTVQWCTRRYCYCCLRQAATAKHR